MGHDIVLIDPETNKLLATTYISGNFHHYKYTMNHMHGRNSGEVALIAQCVIAHITKEGFESAMPDGNPSWAWGNSCSSVPYSREKINGIYIYHMNRFIGLAKEFPTAYWYSDNASSVPECTIEWPDGKLEKLSTCKERDDERDP